MTSRVEKVPRSPIRLVTFNEKFQIGRYHVSRWCGHRNWLVEKDGKRWLRVNIHKGGIIKQWTLRRKNPDVSGKGGYAQLRCICIHWGKGA